MPEIDIDYRSMDDRYRDIAEDIPGFGGLFVDEGILQVYLTPDAFREVLGSDELPYGELLRIEDMSLLQESFTNHLGEQVIERADAGVVIQQADYDYRDLLTWRTRAHELVFTERDDFIGLFIFDADESLNRVVLSLDYAFREGMGLPGDIPEDVLQEELSRLEIPVDAVVFDSGGLMQTTQTLNLDITTSPIGGIRIHNKNPDPDRQGSCSLGFNAVLGSTKGFVTASHCTRKPFNPDEAGKLEEFEQRDDANPPATFFMGRERYDLAAWNATNPPPVNEPDVPNNPCYTSVYPNNGIISYPHYDNGNPFNISGAAFIGCRRADAAFIRYSTQSTLGTSNFGRYAFPSAWQLPNPNIVTAFMLPPDPSVDQQTRDLYDQILRDMAAYPKPYTQTRNDSTTYNPPNPPEPEGIILIDVDDPTTGMTDERTTVQKIGLTTGRTIGKVRKVDADFYLTSPDGIALHLGGFIVEKAATQPRRLVAKGDSGGPVFYHLSGDPEINLLGIVVAEFREESNPGNPSMNVSMGVSTLQHIGEEMQDASGFTLRVSN